MLGNDGFESLDFSFSITIPQYEMINRRSLPSLKTTSPPVLICCTVPEDEAAGQDCCAQQGPVETPAHEDQGQQGGGQEAGGGSSEVCQIGGLYWQFAFVESDEILSAAVLAQPLPSQI